MKILISGGAGFVGSNIAFALKASNPLFDIVVIDNLVRRGSEINLQHFIRLGIKFIHADIRLESDLAELPNFDFIIDASADPSVLSGINSSATKLLQSNLFATVNLLELAVKSKSKFIFLSTSRVYPCQLLNSLNFYESEARFNLQDEQVLQGASPNGISEKFSLTGSRSFYGAAKLSSELIIQEYIAFKNLEASILRCGVIAGPGQFGKVDQGVLVFWLASHMWKKPLKYIGFDGLGKQVRDFLHVEDLTRLILQHISHFALFAGETFNVGGGIKNSLSLKELTASCQHVTSQAVAIDSESITRPADIRYYVTDNTQISNRSGWTPHKTTTELVEETFRWINANEEKLKPILF
jgi:CDP-paratose 2-epimerase